MSFVLFFNCVLNGFGKLKSEIYEICSVDWVNYGVESVKKIPKIELKFIHCCLMLFSAGVSFNSFQFKLHFCTRFPPYVKSNFLSRFQLFPHSTFQSHFKSYLFCEKFFVSICAEFAYNFHYKIINKIFFARSSSGKCEKFCSPEK